MENMKIMVMLKVLIATLKLQDMNMLMNNIMRKCQGFRVSTTQAKKKKR
jgi:hypothetical protein